MAWLKVVSHRKQQSDKNLYCILGTLHQLISLCHNEGAVTFFMTALNLNLPHLPLILPKVKAHLLLCTGWLFVVDTVCGELSPEERCLLISTVIAAMNVWRHILLLTHNADFYFLWAEGCARFCIVC